MRRRVLLEVYEDYIDQKHQSLLNRDMELHRKYAEGRKDAQRSLTYFNVPNFLNKLDSLAMIVASVALAKQGVSKYGIKLLGAINRNVSKFTGSNVSKLVKGG